MVPNVAAKGHSFRGALAYYLHDKRQEGEAASESSERVAWTATRNLATDKPELAREIMIATAKMQDELKAQAGIKNTGRKSTAHVYAYSLSWHPDEAKGLNQAEMVRAADESLRAIGAQDHQALFVAHRDEPHPHVHVILNRVHPETGVMLTAGNDRLKLSEWALAYERDRGKIWCEQREANQQARAQGDFVRASSPTPRAAVDGYAAARGVNDNSARALRDRFKRDAATLLERGQTLRAEHKKQWSNLSRGHADRRQEIYTRSKAAIEAARERIKSAYRPSWSELGKRQTREQRYFAERETRLFGKIENALAAIRFKRVSEGSAADRGFMAAAFNFPATRGARQEALQKMHAHERGKLAAQQRTEQARANQQIKDERGRLLKQNRERFARERGALIDAQGQDRASVQAGWRRLNEDRSRAFEKLRRENLGRKSAQKPTERGRSSPGAQDAQTWQDASTVAREAKEAEKSRQERKRQRRQQGRSRSRRRDMESE